MSPHRSLSLLLLVLLCTSYCSAQVVITYYTDSACTNVAYYTQYQSFCSQYNSATYATGTVNAVFCSSATQATVNFYSSSSCTTNATSTSVFTFSSCTSAGPGLYGRAMCTAPTGSNFRLTDLTDKWSR
jgi:hypothetical protein